MFSEGPLELVRCDVPMGVKAEARFPYPDLKVPIGESLAERRKAAADWFTHPGNGRFARTMVNRYWRQLLGRGLVEPLDDMDAKPWNADLLDWLASDFAEHGFDLQHLLRRVMTSRAYQLPAAAPGAEKEYIFRGPLPRRLTAEQYEDTLSAVTGDWRVNSRSDQTTAAYTREWRLKSDPLSRALGRPIRDQVYTERSAEATTLQALELTNGPLLAARLERGARALVGRVPPAPANLFDSKLMRSGAAEIDIDITGARQLYLVTHDVDSYDATRVLAGWASPDLPGSFPRKDLRVGAESVQAVPAPVPSTLVWDVAGKGLTRFRARALIDERSRTSEIGPAVRFFVFTEKPDPERLIRVAGPTPEPPPPPVASPADLADRLYLHLLARRPRPAERKLALAALAGGVEGVEDLLWALLMTPEFQYLR